MNQNVFVKRREDLLKKMVDNSIAIIFTSQNYNNVYYPYQPSSNFYYLTGFCEPEAIAILIKDNSNKSQYILFNRNHDVAKEKWLGKFAGQDGAVRDFLADQAYAIDEVDDKIIALIEDRERIYYTFGVNTAFDKRATNWLNQIRSKIRSGCNVPSEFTDFEYLLGEMRLIKSHDEINLIKKASEITALGQLSAMKICRPNLYEYELEAELLNVFRANGASSCNAFSTIVACGNNACTLHYQGNSDKLCGGDLVLIDAGAKYQNYVSDVSRTYPVNGKFSGRQKAIYELVLTAQQKTISLIKPGISFHDLQMQAINILTQGLCDLGLLTGDVNELIEQEAYKKFYMHNIGHWLGLDAHDSGAYKVSGKWRRLQEGFVLTIEPGIYISDCISEIDIEWSGIGVRIEDTILVTKVGCDVLTSSVPKTISDIEATMS